MHGEADDLAGYLPGHRGAVRAAEVCVGRLFVEGYRVMDGGGDAGGLQPGLEGVAVRDAQGVLGEDAGAVWLGPGEELEGFAQRRKGAKRVLRRGVCLAAWRLGARSFRLGQQRVVAAGDGLALGDLLVEAVEFGEDDGALQGIHAAAEADAGVNVALALAVDADFAAKAASHCLSSAKVLSTCRM